MKKIILCLLTILLFTNYSLSQEMGNTLLGGNFSFSHARVKQSGIDTGELNFSISPMIGFVVSQNVILGVAVDLVYNEHVNKVSGSISSEGVSIIPFIRYQDKITDALNYFIQPYILALRISEINKNLKSFDTGIEFGLLYFFSDKMSLELSLAGISYYHVSNKINNDEISRLSLYYNLVKPNIGVKYFLY